VPTVIVVACAVGPALRALAHAAKRCGLDAESRRWRTERALRFALGAARVLRANPDFAPHLKRKLTNTISRSSATRCAIVCAAI